MTKKIKQLLENKPSTEVIMNSVTLKQGYFKKLNNLMKELKQSSEEYNEKVKPTYETLTTRFDI